MNAKEAMEMIGKEGSIAIGGLRVKVIVTDVKNSYGKDRYEVTPIAGSGSIWTEQNPLS